MSFPENPKQTQKTPVLAPFDWVDAGHVVVKAGEAVDWNFDDPSSFIKRVQSIEYGLSAETEFAAILSWLGRCSLVHRLDQDGYSSEPEKKCFIPDLMAIFEHKGIRKPVLIEVKTVKGKKLSIPTKNLDSMRKYSEELSIPLLIAWKPRQVGMWFLVDPDNFKEQDEKSVLTLEPAIKNNLLSTIAGDFIVVPKAGAGLFFEAKVVKKTRSKKAHYEGIAQLTNIEFRNSYGTPAKNLSTAILALIFSQMELIDAVDGDKLLKSFVTKDGGIYAQQILRSAIALKSTSFKSLKWRHIAKDLGSYLSIQSLHDEIQNNIGTFVQYQFFQHPENWPAFLPLEWNEVPEKQP